MSSVSSSSATFIFHCIVLHPEHISSSSSPKCSLKQAPRTSHDPQRPQLRSRRRVTPCIEAQRPSRDRQLSGLVNVFSIKYLAQNRTYKESLRICKFICTVHMPVPMPTFMKMILCGAFGHDVALCELWPSQGGYSILVGAKTMLQSLFRISSSSADPSWTSDTYRTQDVDCTFVGWRLMDQRQRGRPSFLIGIEDQF